MWKYLMSFSAIMLAFNLGVFSTGCEEAPSPPPQQPQEWAPDEQPQQPQEPAYPREQYNDQGQSGEQDAPAK